jgi:hypothetical protein
MVWRNLTMGFATLLLTGCTAPQKIDPVKFHNCQAQARALKSQIRTPEECHELLDRDWKIILDCPYDDFRSAAGTIYLGGGDCDNYAFYSMAMLSDDDYPNLALVLRKKQSDGKYDGHIVHLLHKDKNWGVNDYLGGFIPEHETTLDEIILKTVDRNLHFVNGQYTIVELPNDSTLIASPDNLVNWFWDIAHQQGAYNYGPGWKEISSIPDTRERKMPPPIVSIK